MLPRSHSETQEESAQRQANFIHLRFMESLLPPHLFQQVLQNVDFPKRLDWKGQQKNLTFDELKTNFSHINQSFLSDLIQKNPLDSLSENRKNSLPKLSQQKPAFSLSRVPHKNENLMLTLKNGKNGDLRQDQKMNLKKYQISKFERMKTVFGHAIMEDGSCASIFNVLFDKNGEYVISGADDGQFYFQLNFRVIKIWTRDNLALQASLHGHTDFITDMDVSKCNRYLASGSKDGMVIVWDLQTCETVEKLRDHQGSVNNLKFFKFKVKKEGQKQSTAQDYIQFLASCSDDGTIKIYDESTYSHVQVKVCEEEKKQSKNLRKLRRGDEQRPEIKERFVLTLIQEDFRPGSRNKKIDSMNFHQNGYVAAGTSSYKKHQKSVHFVEFSPSGKFLFTGSVDASAKVWSLESDKQSKSFGGLKDEKLLATLQTKQEQKNQSEYYRMQQNKGSCDCLCWSVTGRYAIASISQKSQGNNGKELSLIKVWDSFTGQIIDDLTRNNVQLTNFTFVLVPHPKIEDILLTGSDGGIIILWDIKERTIIKKFIEYGVYSIEQYTMNVPFDGKFSPDGTCFAVGSMLGTVSLFSTESTNHKYQATRVEQFLPFDGEKHEENLYDRLDEEPKVCNFNLHPYEQQAPAPLIGKFKGTRPIENEEYERQLVLRKALCDEEERFIENVKEEGLRNDFFNPENQQIQIQLINDDEVQENQEEEEEIVQRRRPRAISEGSEIANNNDNAVGSQEERNIVQEINRGRNQQRNRPGRRRQQVQERRILDNPYANFRPRLLPPNVNPNIDPENSLYDRESDENYEIEGNDSEEEEFEEEDDQTEEFQPNRENYHVALNNQRNAQEEQKRVSARTERLNRRNQKHNSDEEGSEEQPKRLTRQNQRRIKDESEDDDYAMSDIYGQWGEFVKNPGVGKKQRLKKQNKLDLSSDEPSLKSEFTSEEEFGTNRQKPKLRKKNRQDTRTSTTHENLRSTRRSNRNNRVKYDNMDLSSDFDDQEEEKVQVKKRGIFPSQIEEVKRPLRNNRRVLKDESEESDEDSDVINTFTQVNSKLKGDEEFELVERHEGIQLEENMIQNNMCQLCQRIDSPLIGPFIKFGKDQRVQQGPFYFHRDCLDVNTYSFYNKQKNKWMNIAKALEQLTKKNVQICSRCEQVGATIKCSSCDKHYHGHICSQIYMLWVGNRDYECFQCRNQRNYEDFQKKQPLNDKKQYLDLCKNLPREYLLNEEQTLQQYIPQLNDLVYYFFQGHERFIREYNCFFYCGDSNVLGVEYPWQSYQELLSPTLCRVINIQYKFPTPNAFYLLQKFGKECSDVKQIPQIITDLELQICGQEKKTFHVQIFPHDLSEFLVLKNLYEESYNRFSELLRQNKVINQTFDTRCRNLVKVKVLNTVMKEPSLYPQSNWDTILCIHQDPYYFRERGGRRGQRRPQDEMNEQIPLTINFWELKFPEDDDNNNKNLISFAFEQNESVRLQNIILEFLERKKDQAEPFKQRVQEKIAPDYRCHIRAEMFFDLILARLAKNYYRHQNHLFFDLDMIVYNALLYNGEDSPFYKDAKKVVELIRMDLRKNLNSVGKQEREESKQIQDQYMKPVGKLTMPPGKISSFDQFLKNNLEEEKRPAPQVHRTATIQSSSATGDFRIIIETEESGHSQEQKYTPKLTNDQNPNRRTTRNSLRNQFNNEGSQDNSMNGTGEKVLRKREEAPVQDPMLGKRTRATRQRGLNQQLNEEEDDYEEVESQVVKESQSLRGQVGGNVPSSSTGGSSSRYPKRLRN